MTYDNVCMRALRRNNFIMIYYLIWVYKMYVLCKSCGKEFNDLVKGVRYSSITMGNMLFCSDNCCKDYLNAADKYR